MGGRVGWVVALGWVGWVTGLAGGLHGGGYSIYLPTYLPKYLTSAEFRKPSSFRKTFGTSILFQQCTLKRKEIRTNKLNLGRIARSGDRDISQYTIVLLAEYALPYLPIPELNLTSQPYPCLYSSNAPRLGTSLCGKKSIRRNKLNLRRISRSISRYINIVLFCRIHYTQA